MFKLWTTIKRQGGKADKAGNIHLPTQEAFKDIQTRENYKRTRRIRRIKLATYNLQHKKPSKIFKLREILKDKKDKTDKAGNIQSPKQEAYKDIQTKGTIKEKGG